LGCSTSSAAIVRVAATALSGTGYGSRYDPAVEQLDHRLGRRPHHAQLRMAEEVHVGTGVDLAQRPVQVERVGVEVEIEALGQDHLEDVAGENVLLCYLDGGGVHLG